ncbi:hypothetical protein CEUSTIGMA_g1488.t1 [Chlamydomonas eustigma]|uniref:Methyltransferase domain-containing protein n=1 Tax=Chlamydomonas eustigma TaxID=1157962 RepID=A0A250WT82_9CHLO|nr:hypothetical protein CEUSTIGMA_g1488.t1 [Chlamydomonas eustigma]|eukprot:GAX74038.1 hypothetical protein CEUSTIGMA_g1488.t1 [Chlamydomonas eustigma]
MILIIQVQYADGKTYWAQPSNLRKVVKPAKRIITAETTRQYREACLRYVNPDDICLEVGCHEGVTTAMVQRRCKTIVGVDLSDVTIQIARQKFPQVRFVVVSGDNVEVLKGLSPTGEYDKIMLDIGGIAELPAVMHLVGLYYRTWKNSTLIIKSVFFSRLLEDTEMYKPQEASVSKAAINAAAEREKRREQESSVEYE